MGRRWLTGTKRRSKGCRRTVLFRYRSTAPENEAGALTRRRFWRISSVKNWGSRWKRSFLSGRRKQCPRKIFPRPSGFATYPAPLRRERPQRDPDGPDRGRYLYDGKHDRGMLQGIKGRGDRAGLLCGPLRDRRQIENLAAGQPSGRRGGSCLRNPENMAPGRENTARHRENTAWHRKLLDGYKFV